MNAYQQNLRVSGPGIAVLAFWLVVAPGCPARANHSPVAPVETPRVEQAELQVGDKQDGKAAWYGGRYHGRKTASGERFNKNALTAAHRTLPFGTTVRVTNLENGRSVRVRINDRGPFDSKERIIDVSEAAARRLHMISSGVVPVQLEVLSLPSAATAGL